MIREFHDIDLSDRNSFHVPARAARLVEFDEAGDLPKIFEKIDGGEWYVLSGGNNVLFTKDYEGTLIVPVGESISPSLEVEAGLEWDDLVAWAVERGLWGIENLSAIPGKVGAAPVQNIGAYGVEVKDVIESVTAYFPGSGFKTLSHAECRFGYRDSIFKRTRAVITSVKIKLSTTPNPRLDYADLAQRAGDSLQSIREAIIKVRAEKLPDPKIQGNAGSFFKNPVVEKSVAERLLKEHPDLVNYPAEGGVKLAAGWLIDKAGLKGFQLGRVGVHPRQALVLVNLGGATGTEIIEFAHTIAEKVLQKFGVQISPEVNIL